MSNAINWFEIPAVNFDRAVAFYSTILNTKMRRELFMGTPNAFFPYGEEKVGGAVIQQSGRKPGADGAIIYLNVSGQLDAVLSRVESAGGRIVTPKTDLGPVGMIATILDSEGNHVGLHTPSKA